MAPAMFHRLKKAFGLDPSQSPQLPTNRSVLPSRVSEWASAHGYDLQESKPGALTRPGERFALSGRVGTKPWRLESGRPSRSFIKGHELRARAELDLPDQLVLMVMNRSLKELLEKKAFAAYTDSLQTVQDSQMSEELRWLTMYDEAQGPNWEPAFVAQMAVLCAERSHALTWLDQTLMHDLLHWPADATSPNTPLVLHIARGKLYLRMQYSHGDILTLEHALRVLVWASESALNAFSAKN
jgi:hypothetical protein